MNKKYLRILLSIFICVCLFFYFYLYGYERITSDVPVLYIITGTIPQIGGAIILLNLINTKLK